MYIFLQLIFVTLRNYEVDSSNEILQNLYSESDDLQTNQAYQEMDDASYSSEDAVSEQNSKSLISIDKPLANITLPPNSTQASEERYQYIKGLSKKINNALDLDADEISSLVDEKQWRDLFSYFSLNLDDFIHNGSLSIQLHIRYFACCYIIAFLPADFIFFYPGAWHKLVPKELFQMQVIGDAIIEYKKFERFVKDQKDKKFLVTFYFGRKNTLLEDLKILIRIPKMIYRNPAKIFRELLEFEIRAEGYADFKKKTI
ncbi:hypothetical protein COBT_001775 [Conglomerata obtusa]